MEMDANRWEYMGGLGPSHGLNDGADQPPPASSMISFLLAEYRDVSEEFVVQELQPFLEEDVQISSSPLRVSTAPRRSDSEETMMTPSKVHPPLPQPPGVREWCAFEHIQDQRAGERGALTPTLCFPLPDMRCGAGHLAIAKPFPEDDARAIRLSIAAHPALLARPTLPSQLAHRLRPFQEAVCPLVFSSPTHGKEPPAVAHRRAVPAGRGPRRRAVHPGDGPGG